MVQIFEQDELVMLEDFIRLAKEGEDVRVSVKLRKLNIPVKVHQPIQRREKAKRNPTC